MMDKNSRAKGKQGTNANSDRVEFAEEMNAKATSSKSKNKKNK